MPSIKSLHASSSTEPISARNRPRLTRPDAPQTPYIENSAASRIDAFRHHAILPALHVRLRNHLYVNNSDAQLQQHLRYNNHENNPQYTKILPVSNDTPPSKLSKSHPLMVVGKGHGDVCTEQKLQTNCSAEWRFCGYAEWGTPPDLLTSSQAFRIDVPIRPEWTKHFKSRMEVTNYPRLDTASQNQRGKSKDCCNKGRAGRFESRVRRFSVLDDASLFALQKSPFKGCTGKAKCDGYDFWEEANVPDGDSREMMI